jgi:hypothetical protein
MVVAVVVDGEPDLAHRDMPELPFQSVAAVGDRVAHRDTVFP